MGNDVYLATETMAAAIILILLYANNFGIKQHSKKRTLFNWMLILNEIVVVCDAVTFFPFPWHKMVTLFNILMVIDYTLPSIFKMLFSSYLHLHIKEKTWVSRKPFVFMRLYCLAETVVIFLLCLSGKMYRFEDGVFYSGPAEIFYFFATVFSMLAFLFIVIRHAKKMGTRDTIAVLPYNILTLFFLMLLTFTGINLMVASLSLNMIIMYVTLQTENENYLYTRANIDELTGLYNRAAYEEDTEELKGTVNDSLVYASIDLNGLKTANDSLGHAAGDELICGAAHCIKQAFGGAGKVYRVGGDEFAAIFYTDENNFKFEILRDALNVFTEEWKGKIVPSLTLSVGYVSQKEFPDMGIVGLSKIADKRMYADKSRYYANNGVDRRGQNNAYKLLLSTLYTKILHINITDESFTVIDMFSNEETEDKNNFKSIFDWFLRFAKSGQVHPEDMDTFLSKTSPEYMRSYFKSGNRLLRLSYRRKHVGDFKPALMEIIPTNEYTDDDQSLYLYVKNIG